MITNVTTFGAICDDRAMTEFLAGTADCLARILAHARGALKLATPLGLGKPNVLLNAIYAAATRDAALKLDIYTALSLARPAPKNDLERRFLVPFLDRHFGKDYPDLAWIAAQHAHALPANVRVHEFYLQSGAMLGVAQSQRDYASLNYTHVARDLAGIGINVIVQLIATRGQGTQRRYSLACNPDVTSDLLERMAAVGAARPLVVGVIHPDLAFVGNEAEVDASFFDIVLDTPESAHTLFALPRSPVDTAEYALGMHASTLVRDGGTLQIGIGVLSDALVHALLLRHQRNADYRAVLGALGNVDAELARQCGGFDAFVRGLYGASEMVMDGFMQLVRAGILSRRVFDDLDVEKARATGRDADVSGRGDGRYLRGAFYLGSRDFYAWLRGLRGSDFDGLSMTRVSDINQLYGGRETLDALQRRDARFFNTCMMATLLGAAVSDTLENGQVVSGVGGQYNFVAMAHALEGGRSILLLRATRRSGGKLRSNIVWNYGQATIPRHLRDVYVTEYGVADLRGKSDEDCIIAMLGIADARFVDALAAQAKAAGKLRRDFTIPAAWHRNTPEWLVTASGPHRELFPRFPFGSDFDEVELRLLPALQRLQTLSAHKLRFVGFAAGALLGGAPRAEDAPLFARLALAQPRNLAERLLRRVMARALRGA
jgi:acyl-CoA hydrolase